MITRRDWLRSSAFLSLAPAVPTFLAQAARASEPERDGRVLVVLQLDGGNDGINTVVPFGDEAYKACRRELRRLRFLQRPRMPAPVDSAGTAGRWRANLALAAGVM